VEQDNLLETPVAADVAPEIPVSTQAEKMIPQSKVDEMIRHSNGRVAAKSRQQALEEFKAQQGSQTQSQPSGALSAEDTRRIASEEAQRAYQDMVNAQYHQANQAEGQRIAAEFQSKIDAAKEEFPELRSNIEKVGMQNFPSVAYLANSVEDTAAVLDELFKNPIKMINIEQAAQKSPYLAEQEMKKLAQSISINKQAAQTKIANEPLSRLKPTSIGADNGSQSVSDFRKMFPG
jgi:hypothetical protein